MWDYCRGIVPKPSQHGDRRAAACSSRFEEALLQLEGSIVAVTDPTPNAATDLVDENAQGSMLQVLFLLWFQRFGGTFGPPS